MLDDLNYLDQFKVIAVTNKLSQLLHSVSNKLPAKKTQRLLIEQLANFDNLDFWQKLQTNTTNLSNPHDILQQTLDHNSPKIPTISNPAKQLALKLAGKTILVLYSPQTQLIADYWQLLFENNAKNLFFKQSITSLNYNAWKAQPINKQFGVIDLTTSQENKSVLELFEAKNRQLSGIMPAASYIPASKTSLLYQTLELILFGQLTSFYLASLNKQALTVK